MELRPAHNTSQPESRCHDLLKECRHSTTADDEFLLFLRIHYLYEPDQTDVLSKSLAYLARLADFQGMDKLLTALQTLKFSLLAVVSQSITIQNQADYLLGHVLYGCQHSRMINRQPFRHVVQTITEIWRRSDADTARAAMEAALVKVGFNGLISSDIKHHSVHPEEMTFVIDQIGSTQVVVQNKELREKIIEGLIQGIKIKNHAGIKPWLAIKTDHLTPVLLVALAELKKELQQKQSETIASHYLVRDILAAVTPIERQLPKWQKVESMGREVLWLAIQRPHFPSFYSLRHLISSTLFINALSLQLQQVDQPLAIIHSMIGAMMTPTVEAWLTHDEAAIRLAQMILNKALLFRNRQVISTFLHIKHLISPEYILTAQKYQGKAALITADPIHRIVEDLDQINPEIKPPPDYFKEIQRHEMAVVCQLYRWARQGNWRSYLKLRTQIFEFNDQCQHQVDIVKPMDLQDNILTVLIKGYFADSKTKTPWLKQIAHFIAADRLGYLVDDEPIAGNPFSAALPYVLQRTVNEEADLGLITLLTKHVFHPGEDRHHQNFWHIAIRNKSLGRPTLKALYTNKALRAFLREPIPSSEQCKDVLYEAIMQLDKEKIFFFLNPPLAMSLNKCHVELLQNFQKRYRDYSAEGIRLAGIIDSLKPNLSFGTVKPIKHEHVYAGWFGVQCWNPSYFVMENKKRIENWQADSDTLQKLTGRNEFINTQWDKILFQKTDAIIKITLTCLQDRLAKNPVTNMDSKIKCNGFPSNQTPSSRGLSAGSRKKPIKFSFLDPADKPRDDVRVVTIQSPPFLHYTEPEIKQIFQVLTAGYKNTLMTREKSELSVTELQSIKQHWASISAVKLISRLLPRFCRDYLGDHPEYVKLRKELFPLLGNEAPDFFRYAVNRVLALTAGAHWDLSLHKHISALHFADKLSDAINLEQMRMALLNPLRMTKETEDSLEEVALNTMVELLPNDDNLYQLFYQSLNRETLLSAFQDKYEEILQYHHDDSFQKKWAPQSSLENKTKPIGIAKEATLSECSQPTLADKQKWLFTSHLPAAKDSHIETIRQIMASNCKKLFMDDFTLQFQLHILPKIIKKGRTPSFKKLRHYFAHFFSASYLDHATVLSFSQHFKSLFWDYPNDTCHCLAHFLTEQLAPSLTEMLGFTADKVAENSIITALRTRGFIGDDRLTSHRPQMQQLLSQLIYNTLYPLIQTQHLHAQVPDPRQEDHFLVALKHYIQKHLPPEKLAGPFNEALSATRIWRESKAIGYQSEQKNRPFARGMGNQEWAMRCQLMQQRFQRSSALKVLSTWVTTAWTTLSEQLKETLMNENLQLKLDKGISEVLSAHLATQLFAIWQTASLSVIDEACDIETAISAVIEQGEQYLMGKFSPELVKAIWEQIREGSKWHTLLPKGQYHRIGIPTLTDWLKTILVGSQQTPAKVNVAVLSHYVRSNPDLQLRLEVAQASHLGKIPSNLDSLIVDCLLKTLTYINRVTCEVSSRTISNHASGRVATSRSDHCP